MSSLIVCISSHNHQLIDGKDSGKTRKPANRNVTYDLPGVYQGAINVNIGDWFGVVETLTTDGQQSASEQDTGGLSHG